MHVPLKKQDEWKLKTDQLKTLYSEIYFLQSKN